MNVLDPQIADATTVLIPAAGRVPAESGRLSDVGCPAMIPVGGKPVIYWTVKYLRRLGLKKFVIAVAAPGLYVEDYVRYAADDDCQIQFRVQQADGGLGRTVLDLAEATETRAALVVLGDTLFEFADPALLASAIPSVLVHAVDESYRWCVVETDDDGLVTSFLDKVPDLPSPLAALIGVYHFPRVDLLRAAAHAAADVADGKLEFSSILKVVADREGLRAVAAGEWSDCGHPDQKAESHRRLLSARAFNHFDFDPVLDTIVKRSHRREKLIDEINYLRNLPAELAVLFPRLVDYSVAGDEPWMRMEYFDHPTLAEIFLYERIDGGAWQRIFQRLRDIVCEVFMRHTRELPPEALREMYLDKQRNRLREIAGPEQLTALIRHEGPLEINGRRVANLPGLWPRIEERIEKLQATLNGSLIHGDLCLSNVLYDLNTGACKLIDPRGSFGAVGIYGDPRYDVAKLYHSVYGLYDFIVQDLFRVEVAGDRVSLTICRAPHHDEVCRRFEDVFFGPFDRDDILFITALLFAGMPSLHYDSPARQTAMYVRALQLFDEVFQSNRHLPDAVPHCASGHLAHQVQG